MDLVKNNLSINFGTKLSPVLQEKITECLNNKETRRELKVGLIKKIDDILQFGSDEGSDGQIIKDYQSRF